MTTTHGKGAGKATPNEKAPGVSDDSKGLRNPSLFATKIIAICQRIATPTGLMILSFCLIAAQAIVSIVRVLQ